METRQMTPFFSSTFYALFVTFIFIFENSQISFSCRPPFAPRKIPQFWAKATSSLNPSYFSSKYTP